MGVSRNNYCMVCHELGTPDKPVKVFRGVLQVENGSRQRKSVDDKLVLHGKCAKQLKKFFRSKSYPRHVFDKWRELQ